MKKYGFLCVFVWTLLFSLAASAAGRWTKEMTLTPAAGAVTVDWSAYAAGRTGTYRLYWHYAGNPFVSYLDCEAGQTALTGTLPRGMRLVNCAPGAQKGNYAWTVRAASFAPEAASVSTSRSSMVFAVTPSGRVSVHTPKDCWGSARAGASIRARAIKKIPMQGGDGNIAVPGGGIHKTG